MCWICQLFSSLFPNQQFSRSFIVTITKLTISLFIFLFSLLREEPRIFIWNTTPILSQRPVRKPKATGAPLVSTPATQDVAILCAACTLCKKKKKKTKTKATARTLHGVIGHRADGRLAYLAPLAGPAPLAGSPGLARASRQLRASLARHMPPSERETGQEWGGDVGEWRQRAERGNSLCSKWGFKILLFFLIYSGSF